MVDCSVYFEPVPKRCHSPIAGINDDAAYGQRGERGMTHNDTIRFIVREWMEKNTYLPQS